MAGYSKYNIIYRLQKWMDSVPGQTFLNYAYSWGASLVILGALFKLTHLKGGNLMLFIGMGTEVVVFFLSAFDRPFDKTADGRELPTRITEEYLETGKVVYNSSLEESSAAQPMPAEALHASSYGGQGHPMAGSVVVPPPVAATTGTDIPVSDDSETAGASSRWVQAQQQSSPELIEAQSKYVTELKNLTETLGKVSEQSVRLTRDSEEMENLNRTLTGICKVYEMQLKGASQQIGTIDQINDQTRKMAQQIEQLNKIYARMIEAMTVNMRAANPGLDPSQE